ncbi:MAG TPA: CotH kinase family protein [Pseudobacteroides sp.]|uniref:CotH kinase family protein n=1 Tax=Pseudobacteroides sp. TaxID=1968840 RepID=UPI002F9323F8
MKKKMSCLLTIAMLTSLVPQAGPAVTAEAGQALFINEVMSSNTDTLRDGDVDDPSYGSLGGAYSDWIEIYNSGTEPIDLTGYTLSDSSAKWSFPKGTVPAKGYLLVWASDKNKIAKDGQMHTNFKLSTSGELITLKKPDGTIIDSVTTAALGDNGSYGRKSDGSSEWVIFSKSTPNKSNVYSNATVLVKEPLFSHKGGFYNEGIDLKLSTDQEGIKIYYTLDGSDPVPGAEGTYLYENGISIRSRVGEPNVLSMISNISNDQWNKWQKPIGEVFKCSTIRAASIREDGTKSKIITHTYFIDPNMKDRYNLPVISLVTDRDNLFDDTTGIYVNENFENKGDAWERPVHIEFFEKDGTLAFSQNSGMRINGGYSRKIPQKSFRLYADHGYDDTNKFKYEVFPGLKKKATGKKLDSFQRLILRNTANDIGWTGVMFRDAMMQSLVSHLSIDTQAYRPSVVFLDGEFWGIYNIRERYDSEYLASHYNLDKDKAVILDVWEYPSVQEGKPGDEKPYINDIINYLKTNSIAEQTTYDYINTKMDIKNYIEYNVSEIFFGNYDWPGNNLSVWRYKTDDGKYHPEAPYGQDGRWRWLLRDTDFGFGLYEKSVTFDTLSFATADKPEEGDFAYANQPWAVFLLKTLLKNTDFRNDFINCFADQLNTSFDPKRVKQRIDECKSAIEKAMPEQSRRWRVIDMVSSYPGGLTWDSNLQYIKSYADKRPSAVREHIINKFKNDGVTGTSQININTDMSAGFVRINSIDIKSTTPGITTPSNWSGTYFNGVPVTLKAIPTAGYKFDHWEGVPGAASTADTITFTPSANLNITAVFKPENTVPTPSPTSVTSFKLTGYVNPDILSSSPNIKEGFKVELVGKGISASTNSEGFFEINSVPENLTGYTVRISKDNYLAREIENVVIKEDRLLFAKSSPANIWAGDILIDGIQDNSINMKDVIQIAKSFNSVAGSETYNLNADLNRDNSVNMADIVAIAKHFNATSSSYNQ